MTDVQIIAICAILYFPTFICSLTLFGQKYDDEKKVIIMSALWFISLPLMALKKLL